ncbi:YkgJ family cysteine cluster protein [Candidatus Bathyarchaeota archaeon]|nr:YkgJ family cysteine cluster protein [Candidatus Bathyarchaeota archaeon]
MKSWKCIECGMCCIDYHVVLNINEWIDIVRNYGIDTTIPRIDKLILGKKGDGTCCFLSSNKDNYFCGLQFKKPLACKIWPFKVHNHPKFGNPKEAVFKYQNQDFFIYVDPACNGLFLGKPNPIFKNQVLKEFIEVAVGLREKQFFSTSRIYSSSIPLRFGRRILF